MLLMIDNYDSFTYNLVQYFGELGEEVRVFRNDAITLEGIEALAHHRVGERKARIADEPVAAERRDLVERTVQPPSRRAGRGRGRADRGRRRSARRASGCRRRPSRRWAR